jgi:phytoene synthase
MIPAWLQAFAPSLASESSMEYLARHSHSFRYAARFLPKPYDLLVADVYAFCRFTDDLVDGSTLPVSELRARLADWRRLAQAAHAGTPCGFDLLDRPLLEMGRRGIPWEYAEALIDGVAMDLEPRRFATVSELDVYSYRVASVVGLWLTRLVGIDDARVLARAADLGHAMQLTNILRDVGEDWAVGRLYLPLDILARHGMSEEDLAQALGRADGTIPDGWKAAMEEMMAVAEARYRRALEAVPELPGFFRVPVAVSGLVYRDIHTAIRRNAYDNLRQRAHTSRSRKVWLGLKARLHVYAGVPLFAGEREMTKSSAARSIGLRFGLPLFLLLLLLLAGAASALGVDTETAVRRELTRIETELRGQPQNLDLQLQRLRILHPLSVHDATLLPVTRAARLQVLRTTEQQTSRTRSSGTYHQTLALLLAYEGARDVVEARHAFWPRDRMEPLKRGLPRLDSAVRRDPDNAEIRYLRLTSSYYLPFFLGRKWSVREDFKALAGLLPGVRTAYPAEWYVAITNFVLEKGNLDESDRTRLRRARAEALENRGYSSTAPDVHR